MEKNTITLSTALAIFQDNLDEIKGACVDNMRAIIEEEGLVRNWVHEELVKLRLIPLQHVLKRIISKQQAMLRPRATAITNEMIARAKDHPIEDLYDGKLVRKTGLCPFHSEKTPSFHIKNNRFSCFGCNLYGDPIDFSMRLHKSNFINAVKALQ